MYEDFPIPEADTDAIMDRLPKTSAALVIDEEGNVAFILPKADEDAEAPLNILAITELAVRISDGETTVQELAEAFVKRMRS